MPRYPADQRRRDLATIHMAKAQLGMDDDAYRAILWSVTRVKSSADLDWAGRSKMIDHLKACGWAPAAKPNEWSWVNAAPPDKRALLWKIRRACIEIGVELGKQKRYAEGAARRQHKIERKLEMMDQGELWLLAGVLERTRQHKQEHDK